MILTTKHPTALSATSHYPRQVIRGASATGIASLALCAAALAMLVIAP